MFLLLSSSLFPGVALVLGVASILYVLLDLQLIRGLRQLEKKSTPETSRGTADTSSFPSITVLIAARNEETNLPKVLEALLGQDYPKEKFQVLVIDDRSEDGTATVLRRYVENYPEQIGFLRVEAVPPGISPKKNALMQGLERAQSEWIATTDADCSMGPRWLSSLAQEFYPDTGMVLGLTAYQEPQKGLSSGFGTQALEFVSYGIVSAALVNLGFPVIANANNLAYRRRAFEEAGAFKRHGSVVSGDDDFILQEIHATGRWKIRYCATPTVLMRTLPPESWRHFWEQRKRWASKCGFYRPRQIAFLVAVFAFYAAIPLLLLGGFWNARWAAIGLSVFGVKTLADFAVMHAGLRIFRLRPLLRFFPFTALLHIPLLLAAVIAGNWSGFTWKGQRMTRKA
jgi:cellulose synthase/poly-beta-1,6-N-acetylglucosamine synthase-like glycosyltransferase